jgi:hypothetical protein
MQPNALLLRQNFDSQKVSVTDNNTLVTFTFGRKLQGQRAPKLRRLVHSGWTELPWHSSSLPSVLLGSRAFLLLRWMMPGTVHEDVASGHGFTWLLSLPTWGPMWMG